MPPEWRVKDAQEALAVNKRVLSYLAAFRVAIGCPTTSLEPAVGRIRGPRRRRVQHGVGHALFWCDGAWRCTSCSRHARTREGRARLLEGRCLGRLPELARARARAEARGANPPLGQVVEVPVALPHDLDQVGCFAFCRRCGAYSGSRAVRLLGPCEALRPEVLPRDATRARRRDRLLAGRHPVSNELLAA